MNEDKIIQKLEEHDEQLDNIAKAVVELRADVDEIKENMTTKKDLEPIIRTQDEILGILRRSEQERLVNHHRITVLEDKVEKHEKILAN